MKKVIEKARLHYRKDLPFVLFANPEEDKLQAWFQRDNSLTLFKGQNGFVFTSFNKEQSYSIEQSNSDFYEEKITNKSDDSPDFEKPEINIIEKKNFEALVADSIQAILEQQFQKVVVSRKVLLPISIDFEVSFLKLLSNYKKAFRYLFYHPKVGMWMGASPEQLLHIENNNIKTVALAGTQLYSENIIWETKEKEEQQFVTDFITNQITSFTEEMDISNPYTEKAGNLAHIKTNISAKLVASNSALEIVNALHPTPAICGLPKEPTLDFILANEKYDRKFYSGFLGEWSDVKKNLFVNLRCMEVEKEAVRLYVGCGITKDSNPEKEFFETENKLATIVKIIKI
ncbi:isochorismate synthase [Flavobacterium jejuense]|uniref:isochorismate synthase n=1 Tax=Flavobacterium jejuense TaxID=1544455 RepID=A0ABX0IL40_9FLAO|nr:isochorismate synthase [Flavobacterium jejuense]NHN24303.1 isochorismate synthase [Flavobacterium jejuense]